jgi:hypothetical protein
MKLMFCNIWKHFSMHRKQQKEGGKLCIKTNKKDIIGMNHSLLFRDACHNCCCL